MNILPFEENTIRKVWHSEEWYFSVVDVVGVLSESPKPRGYWNDLKKRENQLSEICVQLKRNGSKGFGFCEPLKSDN